MTQLSDEILIAYSDGELAPAQVRLVDGVLANDEVTLGQLQHLQVTNQRLTRAFASMLQAEAKQVAMEQAASAPPQQARPIEPVPVQSSRNLMVPVVAASVLLVGVGALGGYLAGNLSDGSGTSGGPFSSANFWNKDQVKAEEERSRALFKNIKEPKTTAATMRTNSRSDKKWFETVAARHKIDAPHLFDKYDGMSRNRELALFQFTKTDVSPTLIPLLKDEELVFVGASPLQIKGRSYARLAYRDVSNGAIPVGLYIGKAKDGSLTLERGYQGDDNYVRWKQGPRSYMLIGAVPHWRLIVLSVAVQRQIVQ